MATDSENLQRIADELTRIRRGLGMPDAPPPTTPPPPPPPNGGMRTRTFGTITVTGSFADTDRPHEIRAAAGATLTWADGTGRWGMRANARMPFSAAALPGMADLNCTNHPEDAIGGAVGANGDSAVITALTAPGDPPSNIYKFRECVVVRWGAELPLPALANWPQAVGVAATPTDVDAFLASTDIVPEWTEGWVGRLFHARANFGGGEEGYGAELCERSSFGALLLASNLPPAQKQRVQDRFVRMARDLEDYGCRYPGNGGHGVGRYIVWLIGRMLGATASTALRAADFSELQQVVPYAGAGNLDGYGFVENPSNPVVNMASNYCECCTANRWAGAALLARYVPALLGDAQWLRYTEAYLRSRALTYGAGTGPESWRVVKHLRSREMVATAMGLPQ